MTLKAVVNNITVELPPTVKCAHARVCKRLKIAIVACRINLTTCSHDVKYGMVLL